MFYPVTMSISFLEEKGRERKVEEMIVSNTN